MKVKRKRNEILMKMIEYFSYLKLFLMIYLKLFYKSSLFVDIFYILKFLMLFYKLYKNIIFLKMKGMIKLNS